MLLIKQRKIIYDNWDGRLGAMRFRLGISPDVLVVVEATAAALAWSIESDIEWMGTSKEGWLELFVVSLVNWILIASS
jgi:hypothetical protein